MKSTKFFPIVSLSLSLITLPLMFKKEMAVVKADDTPTYIGRLYSIERVSSQTEVIIQSEAERLWVIAAGRTVHSRWVDKGNNQNENNDEKGPVNPHLEFYYYATATEPKLTGYKDMYNDVPSVIYALEYLESEAAIYYCTHTNININNLVLGYVRGINTKYYSWSVNIFFQNINLWEKIAGPIDDNFINFVSSQFPGGMRVNEFFASFIGDSYYNSTKYPSINSTYLNNDYKMISLNTGNADVDIIHMIASLDGIALNTGEVTGNQPFNIIMGKNSYRHLVSWAGDLQTVADYVHDNNINLSTYFSFQTILNNENWGFGIADFNADCDAQIIGTNLTLDDSDDVSAYIYYHYLMLEGNAYSRGAMFVQKIANMVSGEGTIYQKAHNLIYEFLKLDSSGNNLSDDPLHDGVKYYLLKKEAGSYPDVEDRDSMALSFYSYVINN